MLSQSVLRPINWEEKNAVSTLSFRLSSKQSFGRRDYYCTLGDHRRAVGGRSRANAESKPYLGAPSPSRWGRASTLSAPDGVRASEAPRRVAYAEITRGMTHGNMEPVYQAKQSMCVQKSHATRTQSSIALLALSASTTSVETAQRRGAFRTGSLEVA
jgi:hypothetical protein